MIFNTVIASVASRTITRRKDGKTITIFEVTDQGGTTWTTSRRDIANEANRLVNQSVEIQGRVEQNGTYENHYLDDLRAIPNGQVQQQPIQQAVQRAQQAQPQQEPAPIRQQSWLDDKQWAIMRQAAAKVSAQLSDNPSAFWANLDPLVTFFAYGLKPQEFETPSNTLRQDFHEPQINQFIPQAAIDNDPGRESSSSYDDGDIPFNPTMGPHGF